LLGRFFGAALAAPCATGEALAIGGAEATMFGLPTGATITVAPPLARSGVVREQASASAPRIVSA